jgi:hypothetical protein
VASIQYFFVVVLSIVSRTSASSGWRNIPLVRGEEQNVGARRVHLVRLARADRLLLDRFNFERVQLLIEHLTQIHDDRLANLLPQTWARKISISEILSVGILPCMKIPVKSSCTWKPT